MSSGPQPATTSLTYLGPTTLRAGKRSEVDSFSSVTPGSNFDKILIFYKALPDRIDIVRILHGSRDIAEALN